jgi:FtsZ-binding cell division protein ZapB
MPPKLSSGRYKKGTRSGANNGIGKLKQENEALREQVKVARQAATAAQGQLDTLRAKVTCLEIDKCSALAAHEALQAECAVLNNDKGLWHQRLTSQVIEHRRETEQLRRERDKASSEARAVKSVLCPPRGWRL